MQLFLSSQLSNPVLAASKDFQMSRNRGVLEEVFIKAARIPTLAMGIVYFLGEAFGKGDIGEEEEAKWTKWASGVARDTLRTGIDVVPIL